MSKDLVIYIKLKSYSLSLIKRTANEILESAKKARCIFKGPINMPTQSKRYVVRKSPFVNAKAMRAFRTDAYVRLIQLKNPNSELINELNSVRPNAGIQVSVKI